MVKSFYQQQLLMAQIEVSKRLKFQKGGTEFKCGMMAISILPCFDF